MVIVVVVVLVAAVVAGLVAGVRRAESPRAQAPDARPTEMVHRSPPPAADRIPYARPGHQGPLFVYGGDGDARLDRTLDAPFAVIDFQTTGLSPPGGDRIIEVAVVRIDRDGTVGAPWSTLVDPGRDTGASFVHHIESADVSGAPSFAAIAPYFLSLLDGAVVVAHNATFDEAFLAAELERTRFRLPPVPALCTLRLAQQTMPTANHKLPTLARHLGVPMSNYVSRDHVLATAAVLQEALRELGRSVRHGCEPFRWTGGPIEAPRVVNRVRGLRKGADGYMASLMSKLPATSPGVGVAEQEAYREALAAAMADGQITRDEAQQLGTLAARAGMSAEEVAELNEVFLEGMREAAFEDDVLTRGELRELTRAAAALGVATYFDDLAPTPQGRAPSADAPRSQPTPRKCGHCGQPGHYRPRCPQLSEPS